MEEKREDECRKIQRTNMRKIMSREREGEGEIEEEDRAGEERR